MNPLQKQEINQLSQQKPTQLRNSMKLEKVEQPLFSDLGLIDYVNSDEILLGEQIQIPEMEDNIIVETAALLLSLEALCMI